MIAANSIPSRLDIESILFRVAYLTTNMTYPCENVDTTCRKSVILHGWNSHGRKIRHGITRRSNHLVPRLCPDNTEQRTASHVLRWTQFGLLLSHDRTEAEPPGTHSQAEPGNEKFSCASV